MPLCVCVCVCVCVCSSARARVYALRIVSWDKILRCKNNFINIKYVHMMCMLRLCMHAPFTEVEYGSACGFARILLVLLVPRKRRKSGKSN